MVVTEELKTSAGSLDNLEEPIIQSEPLPEEIVQDTPVATLPPEDAKFFGDTGEQLATPVPEDQLKEVAQTEAPVETQEPIVEPVVQPIEEKVVEEVKPTEIKAPEPTKEEKVESAQDIQSKELANKATEDAQKTQEVFAKTTAFNEAAMAGNLDLMNQLATDNPDLSGAFANSIRNVFGDKSNREFFSKYNGATNDEMKSALTDGSMVIGSKQYNLLPEAQRRRFEQFNKLNAGKKTDFTSDDENVISLESITTQLKGLFSFDLRAKMEEKMNDPALTKTRSELESKQNEISEIDDAIEFLEDDLEKEFPGMPRSFILAEKAKRGRDLIRSKNGLVNQYNAKLGTYKDMKSDLDMELEISKFEDQQQKAIYTTALGLYETRRTEARSDEQAAFLAKNNAIAADVKFQRDLATKQFQADLDAKKETGGKYETDKNGRLLYLNKGISTVVTDAKGDVVYSDENTDLGYEDTVNFKDGIFYTQRSYDDGTIQNYTSDIEGNRIGPSLNTVDFIKQSEGFRGSAYQDSAGVWTVGYGFTNIDGKPVSKGDTITEIVAGDELQKQIAEHSQYEKLITVDLSEEQMTALNSFEYNLGKGIWNTTGKEIIEAINNGDLDTASRIMLAHNKARDPITGELKEIKGLSNRRNEEASLLKVAFDPASQFSQSAQDWGRQIQRGEKKITDIPASEEGLRTEVVSFIENNDLLLDADNPIIQSLQSQFDLVDGIVDWEDGDTGFFGTDTTNESLIEDISGGFQISPFDALTGEKGQMLSKIQFLLDEQPLNKLIEVKAQGATFGALSNAELALLTKSASLLNSAAQRNEQGELTGFRLSEQDLKENLSILRDGYKKSIEKKTGVKQIDLAEINANLDRSSGPQVLDLSSSLDF